METDLLINELEIPEQRVSKLYPLPPLGIGTPKVECMTSYLSRLAQAHNITSSSLLRYELLPLLKHQDSKHKGTILVNSASHSGILNYLGMPAQEIVTALESLTLHRNLKFITLIPWKDNIVNIRLTKNRRSWCPKCYLECIDSGTPLYDQLLWTLNAVKVCPIHRVALQDLCSKCNQPISFLNPSGKCPKCSASLYCTRIETSMTAVDEYQVELSHQLGHLLEFSSSNLLPSRQFVNIALNRCLALYFNNSTGSFSQCLGISQTHARQILKDQYMPSLSILATLSLYTGVSILNLLLNNFNIEDNICSLNELFEDVKSSHTFFKNIPDFKPNGLSLITPFKRTNHKISEQELFHMQLELQGLIVKGTGESLTQISKRLNCSTSTIKRNFPNHYEELKMQLNNTRQIFVKKLQTLLQTILQSNQDIPTLKQIANKLDITVTTLRYNAADLCNKLVQKRKSIQWTNEIMLVPIFVAVTDNSVIEALESALLENPPPSLLSIRRRLGLHNWQIRNKYPELSDRIIQRYKDYKETQRHRISEATIEIHSKGIYPSEVQLRRVLGFSIVSPEQRNIWKTTLQELGYHKK